MSSYSRTRKHYRVAQGQGSSCCNQGAHSKDFAEIHNFICQKKKHIICIATLVAVAVFLKGFLFGYIIGMHNK